MKYFISILGIGIGFLLFLSCSKQAEEEDLNNLSIDSIEDQEIGFSQTTSEHHDFNREFIFSKFPDFSDMSIEKETIHGVSNKEEMDQWVELTSTEERIKAFQIPESLLKDMSTENLIYAVLNYPLRINFLIHNNPQSGIESLISQFNGLSELLERKDVGTKLLDFYTKLDPVEELGLIEREKNEYATLLAYTECLLAQDSILSNLSEKQLYELISFETKHPFNKNKFLGHNYKLWLLAKALQKTNYEPFEAYIKNNNELETFLNYCLLPNDDLESIIVEKSKEFLLIELHTTQLT